MTDAREQERYHARELAKLRKARRAPAKKARPASPKADPATKLKGEPGEGAKRKAFTYGEAYAAFRRQKGKCAACQIILGDQLHHLDHVLPVELGGETNLANLQLLCIPCHKAKTREDVKRIAKAKRQAKMMQPKEPSKHFRRWRPIP